MPTYNNSNYKCSLAALVPAPIYDTKRIISMCKVTIIWKHLHNIKTNQISQQNKNK